MNISNKRKRKYKDYNRVKIGPGLFSQLQAINMHIYDGKLTEKEFKEFIKVLSYEH